MRWPKISFSSPPKKKRKKQTIEEQTKKLGLQIDRKLNEQYLKAIETDEDVRDAAIAKKWGHLIPEKKASDPFDKVREALLTRYAEDAEKLISNDPELQERLKLKMAEKLLEEPFTSDGGGRGGRLSGILSELDQFEELADRLGMKGSGDFLKDISVALVQILPQILPAILPGAPGAAEPKYVVLKEDGSAIEMGPQQYKKLLESRQPRLAPSETEAVGTPPPPIEEPPIEPPIQPPVATPSREPVMESAKDERTTEELGKPTITPAATVPEGERSFVLQTGQPEEMPLGDHSLRLEDYWEPFLVMEPNEWIDDLMGKRETGDEDAQFILVFLARNDVDRIIETLEGFKDDPEVGQVAQRIIASRDWLQSAWDYLKECEVV